MAAESPVDIENPTSAAAAYERLLVEFELDTERYGVDIADIREIIRYQTPTVVPGTPEIVEGIINLRGRVTPIVDLRKRVGLHASDVNDATRIIVIEVDDTLVGVHVDAVTGVVSLKEGQLQALSGEVTTDRSNYLEGVADIDGRLIILINLQRALEGGAQTAAPPRDRGITAPSSEETEATVEADGMEADAPGDDQPVDEAPVAEAVVEATSDEAASDDASDGTVDLGLNVELLEQSFEAVKPRAEELVALFYDKLFEQHPAVQPLFANTDIQEQQGKLLSALATVVASLRQPDVLVPHLEELGRRHVGYGAEPAHYEAVGEVLIESLGEIAGELWTDDLRNAWSDAITLVAAVMIDAAAGVESPAEPKDAPVAEQPAAKASTAKKPAAKKPAAKKTTSKASTSKPAARKPAAKKAAAK